MKLTLVIKFDIIKFFLFFIVFFTALFFFSFTAQGADADYEGASDAFADALLKGKNTVDLGSYNIPSDKVGFLLQYSQSENPKIFWYPDSVSYSFFEDGLVSTFSWENAIEDFSEINQMKAELEKQIRYVVSVCFRDDMTDLEKVISAHDYLTETASYKKTDDFSFYAYSVFVRKEGVCQGYTYAFKCLMDYAGIECYCVGSSQINHAWNIVLIDGEYYHVDVTSDDVFPKYNGTDITSGRELHVKLLCSDAAFNCEADDVVLYGKIPLPECKSTLYDNAFFKDVVGTMEFINGEWYYVEPNEYINGSRRILKTDGEKTEVFFEWDKAVYSIESYDGYLYCAVKDTVYKMKLSGESEVFCSTIGDIFGISVYNGNLYYGVYRKKSYAICSKILPPAMNCVEGISMNVDSENFILNIHVKIYPENEKGILKYKVGGKETKISIKDIPLSKTVSIPISKELFKEEIEISFIFDGEERIYKISVEEYGNKIINGNFDENTKKIVKALFDYTGVSQTELPQNAFSEFENVLYDNSDEISFVESEISINDKISLKIRFSSVENVNFTSDRRIEKEKDGLYYLISINNLSIYELDKVYSLNADGIAFKFSVFGFAHQLDESSKERIYFAHEYGKALNEYRKITEINSSINK